MLFWAWEQITENMVWVGTNSAKQCFISFESEIAGSRVFWVKKPSSFHSLYEGFKFEEV